MEAQQDGAVGVEELAEVVMARSRSESIRFRAAGASASCRVVIQNWATTLRRTAVGDSGGQTVIPLASKNSSNATIRVEPATRPSTR
jgi:hypothetical protein